MRREVGVGSPRELEGWSIAGEEELLRARNKSQPGFSAGLLAVE